MQKLVMITGVNGFIGSHLVNQLIGEGYQILGVSIEERSLLDKEIIYEQADIADMELITRIFEKYEPEYVIHLAAIVHKQSMLAKYEDFYRINYLASKNIFENCIKYHTKKLLFASTVEVYDMVDQAKLTEESTLNPQSDYGKTKLMAEQELERLAEGTELEYAMMRFAPVYGKGFTLNLDRRIYLKKDKVMYYFGKGDYFYNMCSIHNICDFVSKYIAYAGSIKGAFNISDTENMTIKELVQLEKKVTKALTVKMPYYLTELAINIVDKGFGLIGKKSIISPYNFKKIFKCIIFGNKKMLKVTGKLKWHTENTLYNNEKIKRGYYE